MTSKHQQAGLGELFIASSAAARVDDGQAAAVPELAIASGRIEIVFIESDVADIDTLIRGFGAGKEIVILDAARDGLRQIAEALEGRSGIDALHVISHGQQGSISLGSLMLSADDLPQHAADLQAIGRSMAEGGDILLYGCDVGAGDEGLALVGSLAAATGADVAASSNLTGAAVLGGDWELEVRRGDVDTPAVVDPALAAMYHRTLASDWLAPIILNFNTYENFSSKGSGAPNYDPEIDILYKIRGSDAYVLKIDGTSSNISTYESDPFIASDTSDGEIDETEITFSFETGQVFTPVSINVANFEIRNSGQQKLIFVGYDASGNPIGSPKTITTSADVDGTYLPVPLDGLIGISKLKVFADPTSNNGRMIYLVFDDFEIKDIKPAGPPPPPAPVVTSVSSTNIDDAYRAGQEITVTVTFDQEVVVAGGTPTLLLETGQTDRLAVYTGGSGTDTLSFKYTVQPTDSSSDLNYFSTGSLSLAGATIKLKGGTVDASLVLPALNSPNSLGGGKAIVIDTAAPTLEIISAKSTLKAGETTTVTFKFSEAVTGFERGDVLVSGGTLGNLTLGQDGKSYSATFTPTENTNNGTASITVEADSYADVAGNLGGFGATPSITFDTLAPGKPAAPVLHPDSDSGAAGDGITSDNTPQFIGAAGSVEGATTVRLYAGAMLIGQTTANANGSWSATSNTALPDATYQITVVLVDAAQNVSAPSEPFELVVDTVKPATPLQPDLAPVSDSGAHDDDDITNAVTQTIRGAANSAEKGSLITLYNDGVAIDGASTTVGADGSWSIDLAQGHGAYTITARSRDAAGNLSDISPALNLTVDRQAPDAPDAPLLHADSNSGSKADTITNVRTPTFYGVAGSVEGGATVRLYADGDFIGSAVATANGSWSVTASQLDGRTYTITAEAVDFAGNVSEVSSGTSVTIDFTAPAAQVADVAFSDDTNIEGDFVTSIAAQSVIGKLTAPLAQGEWVGVSFNNGTTYFPATVDPNGEQWSLAEVTLAGKGTLVVRVFDAAGNPGAPFSHGYELDVTAPGAPSTPDLTDASDSGANDQDNITGVTRPTFTGTAEEGATITLYADGTAVGSGQAGVDGKWTVTVDEALAGATYDFTVKASDLAGNQGGASPLLEVTIVTDAPSITNTTFTLASDSGIDGDLVTRIAAQTLSGKLSAALAQGEQVEVWDGAIWRAASAGAGDDTWMLAGVTLTEGPTEYQVRVINAIGNEGLVDKRTVTLDTEAPTVKIESSAQQLKAGQTATITFTFSDDPGNFSWDGSAGDLKVGGGTLSALSGTGPERTATFTPDANTQDGVATITVAGNKFFDLAGNGNEVGVMAQIPYDTLAPAAPTAPVLAPGSDSGTMGDRITFITRPTFTGSAESGSTVTLYDAEGNPIGSGTAVNGQWSIAPTAALDDGAHTISATATDAAGNKSQAVAGQQITIDTTPPTLAITSNVDSLKIGETATISFTFSEDPGVSFGDTDIRVHGGKLGELEKDGLVYTAVFTPTAGEDLSTATIWVGAGSYVDPAGNNGGAGAPVELVFDTKAPDASSAPDLEAASDTGTSDVDDITGDTTPTFTGSAESGATVRLYADGVEIGSALAVDGAWRITATALDTGKHAITAIVTDASGNEGPESDSLDIEIVTGTPSTMADSIKLSSDSGASETDRITRIADQTLNGTLDAELEAGEYVEVSLDGGDSWNRAESDGASWSFGTTLVEGSHPISVRVVNVIGNAGEAYTKDYQLDTQAPTVTVSSNVDTLKRGETATITFSFSEAPGDSFTWDDIAVQGGKLGPLSGSGLGYTVTFTPTDGVDNGMASISVKADSYLDLAGNKGSVGNMPALAFDTLAPGAPPAPTLAAASDTGTVGDGITRSTTQVIEGSGAVPGALVRLYEGEREIGSERADTNGHWSISITLGIGAHALRVVQYDDAGNGSVVSAPFQLTVEAAPVNPTPNPNPDPNPDPNPPTMVDGMPVTTRPVTLPGGVRGTTVEVPIVTGGRTETDGQPSLADIPLASGGGQVQLLAQLPVGYGLSSSGGVANAQKGLEFLIAAIKAATPTHAPDDQGHLVQNGTSFLNGLDYSTLLVHTVKPVSNTGAGGALVLDGAGASGGQGTALVIETGGMASGSAIDLVGIDFAALIGAATVSTGSSGSILAGDAASQHFTVVAGGENQVYAGGGNDLLSFAAPDAGSVLGRSSAQQAPGAKSTVLHGGQALDAASFAGSRDDYQIDYHHGHVVVGRKGAPNETALVINVEQLRFDDGTIDVANDASLDTLAGMYQTVFGRQADVYGIEFWVDRRDDGVSWGAIVLDMIGSSEHAATGGAMNGDAAHDIALLYQALFNRAADDAGLAFWQAAMDGGMSMEQVATWFVESAEMVGHQRGALDWDFQV
ncbi:Ig-like domain-containing protein [Telluria beijingensis]|uniref:Ig-like domain-containing protein n=1 Tax=Telluria beijingensis TaxID=3068633 RepID=UPI002795BC28|nr:Ig-like domain-containing protein [Massilia sp. REN29]